MKRITLDLDGDLRNADWTKQTWDLIGIDTADALLAWIEANGKTVAQFKALPVYQLNVGKPGFEFLVEI